MRDPYEEDKAYDSWRYDQFGDVIVPDEYDDYYTDEYDDPGYELTYADEIEVDVDGF